MTIKSHTIELWAFAKRPLRLGAVLMLAASLYGCAVAKPNNTENACEIFRQYPDWYVSAKEAEQRWGTPVPVALAFIQQESSFQSDAQPERTTILGIIPGPRKSSSYGYTQALDSTWQEYQESTGNRRASRVIFHDAVDFIGWYNYQGYKRNQLERNNTYYMYIAYHEGHSGFADKKSWQNKQWLKDVATKVANRAIEYHNQLKGCKSSLNKGNTSWWVF
ncbi:hypothetical protein SAMN02745127_00329 [Oceanospirillum multiglobuliferum]|nr:transglycosylase SLT domain-containing protein [Oceanospirillum multiglobuliferum]SJZ50305.1 hypothetical protein SAMN02745127_00329 [Oceanospirillum multiglobuliferum]